MRIDMSSAELRALMGAEPFAGAPSADITDASGRRLMELFSRPQWEPASSLLIEAAKRHPSYDNVIRGEPAGGPRRSLLFALRRGEIIAEFEEQVYAHYAAQADALRDAQATSADAEPLDPTVAAETHLSKLREHSLKRRALRKPVRKPRADVAQGSAVSPGSVYDAEDAYGDDGTLDCRSGHDDYVRSVYAMSDQPLECAL
jgi:hypothetical protein